MPFAVEQLEREFAAGHGLAGAVATGFGRAALRLALEAMDVRGGDVLVPEFVCAQVVEAVRIAGGRPRFYRVAQDLSVQPEVFRAAFTETTRAAIAVHYFGRPLTTIAALAAVCRERGVPLVEDCALTLGVPGAGQHGDIAVFSFTKSDWCHGGGLLAARSPGLLARAAAIRNSAFRPFGSLLFRYGLLRRADFAANRPTLARAAGFAGQFCEGLAGFGHGGFYDCGRFDALLSDFAARRARRMLRKLTGVVARRRAILGEIRSALGAAQTLLFWPSPESRDSAAFLALRCASGQAHAWRDRAANDGVTLRLCWPAYQDAEAGQESATLRWLADHLVLMEIHPDLSGREVQRIVRCLKSLAV